MPIFTATHTEALLSICRQGLGTDSATQRTAAHDWPGTLNAAGYHGLIGPIYSATSKSPNIPEHISEDIQSAFLTQAAHNFQRIEALQSILYTFHESGIQVAVWKGPAVALLAYGHVALREFADLDLLVQHADLSDARAILSNLGYKELIAEETEFSALKDLQFTRESDKSLVELHWALNPPNRRFPLEATGVWDRLQVLQFNNQSIYTLGLEDTLLYLCIHGNVHGWTSLKWIFDIASLLNSHAPNIDWGTVARRCKELGCQRTLSIGVRLASAIFLVTTPAELNAQLSKDAVVQRLVETVTKALLENSRLSRREIVSGQIQAHDRLWDRLSVAVSVTVLDLPRLLPKAARPISASPLRFLSRPLRLLRLYGFDWLRTVLFAR